MSVATMLEGKSKNIISASPEDSISSVVALLAKHRIGAVIICDDAGKVKGIISERDVVREIARDGGAALEMQVSKCMTSKVLSCTREDTINYVMEVMTANRFRHMPVINDGNLLGIISIGDVVKCKIEQAERDAQDMRDYIAS